MDSKYIEIYAFLYDRIFYPEVPATPWAGLWGGPRRIRREWIELHMQLRQAVDKAGDALREDAKAFLFMNLSYMVIAPVLIAEDERAIADIREHLPGDVAKLVAEAQKRSERQGSITGHVLIETIAKSWDELKTMQLRVWGASAEQERYENG